METASTEEEKEWCSEMFVENVHYAEQHEARQSRPIHHHNQARRGGHAHHNHHHRHQNAEADQEQTKSPFTTLNCFTIVLDQKEFQQLYIKSADLYVKLDLGLVEKMLGYVAQSLGESNESRETAVNMRSSIVLEVNGKQVKEIELSMLGEYLANNDESIFEYADVKGIVEDEIYRAEETVSPVLRIRVLFKNEQVNDAIPDMRNNNTTDLSEKLAELFAEIEESVALHVKFGDKIPSPVGGSGLGRNKRQQKNQGRKTGGAGGARAHGKHYRDCADLARAGYTTANYTCCRETITFSMDQIGWSHWILSPKIIEYKYCRGGCMSEYSFVLMILFIFGQGTALID
jgi:hypothetical protein